jgi:hypothetical protein
MSDIEKSPSSTNIAEDVNSNANNIENKLENNDNVSTTTENEKLNPGNLEEIIKLTF